MTHSQESVVWVLGILGGYNSVTPETEMDDLLRTIFQFLLHDIPLQA